MTRDEYIKQADKEITEKLYPLIRQDFPKATLDDWWDIRAILVDIEYACREIITTFDMARIEEEYESGKRQRHYTSIKTENKPNNVAPSLEDLGL